MLHKDSNELNVFKAGDHTILREVLHPKNDKMELPFSLASAHLEIGNSSLPHKLAQSETYYFLRGEGLIYISGEKIKVSVGHVVYVPPNAEQYVENTGNEKLEFLCIVSPPWSEEGEEITTAK